MGKPTNLNAGRPTAEDRAENVAAAIGKEGLRGPAPVHLWTPDYCGEMDLVIRADGVWVHDGTPIRREALVRMFANILKFEDGRHYLVTPVEKLGIVVEDAPFIAVDATRDDAGDVTFVTNLDETATLDHNHALSIEGTADHPVPYIDIRNGLRARIDRKTYYRVADWAEQGPDGRYGLISRGSFFPLER